MVSLNFWFGIYHLIYIDGIFRHHERSWETAHSKLNTGIWWTKCCWKTKSLPNITRNRTKSRSSVSRAQEGVPEERRILNKVEDSRSYLTDHAVQALLPALPLRQ